MTVGMPETPGQSPDPEASKLRDRVEKLEEALRPFSDICDAEQMKWVRDEQVLELATRAEVPVSEKLRGRHFRAARAALSSSQTETRDED